MDKISLSQRAVKSLTVRIDCLASLDVIKAGKRSSDIFFRPISILTDIVKIVGGYLYIISFHNLAPMPSKKSVNAIECARASRLTFVLLYLYRVRERQRVHAQQRIWHK